MDALKSLVQPFVSGGSMVDGMKLVVIGGTVETARRMSSSAWSHFVNSFFLTAHFSEEDHPYDWLMLWLSRRPEWQRSREFETTTRAAHAGAQAWEEDEVEAELMGFAAAQGEGDGMGVGEGGAPSSKTRVIFQPTFDSTHTIYWRGHWLRVRRSRGSPPSSSNNSSFWGGSGGGEGEVLSVSVIARSNTILKALVLQAKREYEAEAVHRIQIFFADPHGTWRWADSRHKRPLGSIVLDPGVKEMLLGDARDFLGSEKWYNDRGIPFRRGYLLHGVPGSGKSSLIHAIAGELMLDIYVVSLSSAWISDTVLMSLMGRVPKGAILLLEDLDAAFTRSVSRMDGEGSSGEGSETKRRSRDKFRERDTMSELNTLSLSGLLNALDGVAAAEGRILFATTNHLEKLDSALSRPGRMDVWVEFKNASKWQAEALFRNFFPSSDEDDIPLDDGEGDIDLPGTPTSLRSASTSSLWSTSTLTSSSASGSSSKSAGGRGEAKKAKETPALPQFGSSNKAYMPPPVAPEIVAAQHSARPLDGKTLAELAKRFADSVPEGEFSVAALQGYLLKNKSRPEAAAAEAAAWVVAEREMRERLRKEKEARETKEKAEREKKRKEKKEAEAAKLKKEKEEAEKAKAQMAAMGQVPTSPAGLSATTTPAAATSTVPAVSSNTVPVVPTSTVLAAPTATTPAMPATTPALMATTPPAASSPAASTVDGSLIVAPPAPEAAAASNAATPVTQVPESSSAGATPAAPADGASSVNVPASNADAASASVTPATEATPSADAVPPETPAATASDSEGSESDYDDDLDEAYRSPRPVRRVSAWAMAPGRHGQSQWANYIPPQTSDWRGSSWL
ncbi:P-loop containing nucleoside triphosphate hydrolase protein [Favolaschia claudopus]|uniref:P-loop containing nucleoside triphosphate hydrolase protein n=1 Tax=Favolaschia claudopus TaxID=2862362 RepID=A0AAV9ZBL5_9AGAR